MTETNQELLSEDELKGLHLIDLHPEYLPKTLDDFIVLFLQEFADVQVQPADSSQLTGKYEAILGSGISSSLLGQGATIAGTSYVADNIKQQTQVQEWIHWKKFALEHKEFERWKNSEEERYERMYWTMANFIRSEAGKQILEWESNRDTGCFIFTIILAILLLLSPWITAWPFGFFALMQVLARTMSPVGLGQLIARRAYDLPDIETLIPRRFLDEDGELVLVID